MSTKLRRPLNSSGRLIELLSPQSTVAGLLYGFTAALILAPLGYVLVGSFLTDTPSSPHASGTLANWLEVYGSAQYLLAFAHTMALSTAVAAASLAVGGLMAWIVTRTNAPGRNQLAPLLAVPLMLSSLITTLAWIALAAPNAGFINSVARSWFGVGPVFNIYSFAGMVLVLVSHYAAFAFINIAGSLQTIDGSLEEASYMLGVGPIETGLRMTIPLIWPSLASTFLIIFVLNSENFSVPALLGSPLGYNTLASRIFFDMAVEPARPNLAAAAGTMLLWISVLGTIWHRRVLQRTGRYVTMGGKGGRTRVTDLGRWRFVATCFLLLFLFLAIALPYAALLFSSFLSFLTPRVTFRTFTLANYTHMVQPENIQAIGNSLVYSILGGLLLTFLYTMLAYFIKRSRSKMASFVDHLVIVPTTIPALVLAIGILWTFVGIPLPIYGTSAILIIAYYIRFTGLGVRQARTALVQISGELDEAARIAGASPLRTFYDISLPLLRPAVLALWTILFISIFTEIGITILLYSSSTVTLPVTLWNDMARGQQTSAFAIAIVQATIIFVIIFVAHLKFGILRKTNP